MAEISMNGMATAESSNSEFDKIKELTALLSTPLIKHAASQRRSLPVGSMAKEGRSDRALLLWIAVQTRVWLSEVRAVSIPIVEHFWRFDRGESDIDMRIGVHGEYRKIKLTTGRTGPTSFCLKIQPWKRTGEPERIWERYAVYRGSEDKEGFETLPVR